MNNRELSDELCDKAFDLSVDDDYAGALEHYNKAIEADPTNPNSYIGRADVYQDMAEDDDEYIAAHKKSISEYTIALQYFTEENDKEKADTLVDRASSYAIIGEPDKVIADCNEAINLDPENHYAYYWRASALQDKGKSQEAFPDYQKAAELGDEKAAKILKEEYNWPAGNGSNDSDTPQAESQTNLFVKLAGAAIGGAILFVVMGLVGLIIGAIGGWFLSGVIWKIRQNKTNN